MKKPVLAVTLLSALLLTACGSKPAVSEPTQTAPPESSAAETTTAAAETTAVPADIPADPAVEAVNAAFQNDAALLQSPMEGIRLGMQLDEVKALMGESPDFSGSAQNPAYAMQYDYYTDSLTLFGETFSVSSDICFFTDAEGYVSLVSFGLGSGKDGSGYTAAQQKADKEKLYQLICSKCGEPAKKENYLGDDNDMYTWPTENCVQYWLCGGSALWGIEGCIQNSMNISLADADGNALSYCGLTGKKGGSSAGSSGGGGSKKKSSDSLAEGEYWCCGKNDTCKNKTYSPYDLYCHSCDPDDNNIEGDQRKSSSGKITDRDGNGKVDEDDWEKAWKDYLNDHMN